MKIFVVVLLVVLSPLLGVVSKADNAYARVDREMIQLLGLTEMQGESYAKIMQKQRVRFLALESHQWNEELALYRDTFALLKPVLTTHQHARFVGIINSVIEFREVDFQLAMEN